ncbi:hypothetical protein ABLN87_17825 [Ruegeria sp. SCPT10]|uniref:hypothetical protein n=1 Tax=Ruegeria sp. SCP10 TaxID=3141377 RepID=UPI00333749CA
MKEIPEIPLVMQATTMEAEREIGFKWADASVGRRSKIGGKPDLVQDGCRQVCKSCGSEMTFYAQIDSVGDEVCLADVGMVYVFVCFDCFTSESFVQSA